MIEALRDIMIKTIQELDGQSARIVGAKEMVVNLLKWIDAYGTNKPATVQEDKKEAPAGAAGASGGGAAPT